MLQEIIDAYLCMFPEERESLCLLNEQLAAGEDLQNRKNFRGHITGGAVVLSPDRSRILVIHHNFLNKWLQPGGHWDPEETSPWEAARREAREETSVQIAEQLKAVSDDLRVPLDIGSHPIMGRPERQEPFHYHHDFRYVFLAARNDLVPRESEVSAASWMLFDDPRLKDVAPIIAKLRQYKLVC